MIQLLSILVRLRKVLKGFQISKLVALLFFLIENSDKFDDIIEFIWNHLRNEPFKFK